MAEDEPEDRLIVELNPGGPVELEGLAASFSGLARIYERHFRSPREVTPKLYVTRLTSGSVIAEIAPYVTFLGETVAFISAANNIANFTKRISAGIRAFADLGASVKPVVAPAPLPDREDAEDLQAFIKPLTGRRNASLAVRHAKFHKKTETKEITVSYDFDSAELDRASINIDRALTGSDIALRARSAPLSRFSATSATAPSQRYSYPSAHLSKA